MPLKYANVAAFISQFEACRLPRAQWTHHAHLVAGFWYVQQHAPERALDVLRQRIRAHNESVGTANTDDSGYHETITRLYVHAIATHAARYRADTFEDALALLLASPLANSSWPLTHYSKELLFSGEARRHWVEPDLLPL